MPPAAPQLGEPAPASKSATRLSWRQWLMFVVVLVVAVSASIVLTRSVLRSGIRSSAPRPNDAVHDFWGQFFDKPNEELKVVYADSSFALWQRLSGKTLNLGDYLSHKYLDVQNDKFLELAEQRIRAQPTRQSAYIWKIWLWSLAVRLACSFQGMRTPSSSITAISC